MKKKEGMYVHLTRGMFGITERFVLEPDTEARLARKMKEILSPIQIEMLVLRHDKGLTFGDIGKELDRKTSSVQQTVQSAYCRMGQTDAKDALIPEGDIYEQLMKEMKVVSEMEAACCNRKASAARIRKFQREKPNLSVYLDWEFQPVSEGKPKLFLETEAVRKYRERLMNRIMNFSIDGMQRIGMIEESIRTGKRLPKTGTSLCQIGLEEVDFCTRTYNTLKRSGYDTIADLAKAKKSDLERLDSVGKKTIDEISDVLFEFGVVLQV